jgi:translocation and assembly module TamB
LVNVRLGDIRIEGDMVQASLTGERDRPLRLVVADELKATGNIRILSGKLDVLGKEFRIEPSLVSLQGDPSNPFVNVTAYHDTKAGSRIYIDYVGELSPITEDKITFRSDPARPENEVLAELAFGSDLAKGTLAGGTSSSTQGAEGGGAAGAVGEVGAGLASAQVNVLLQSITPLRHFETQLSTTDEGALKTTVGYELGEQVTASASYAAESSAGTQAQTEVSLEWRFRKNWVLRGSVATSAGQNTAAALDLLSLDLLWKHRY